MTAIFDRMDPESVQETFFQARPSQQLFSGLVQSFCRNGRNFFCGLEYTAKKLGLHPNTISSCRSWMVSLGVIKVVRRGRSTSLLKIDPRILDYSFDLSDTTEAPFFAESRRNRDGVETESRRNRDVIENPCFTRGNRPAKVLRQEGFKKHSIAEEAGAEPPVAPDAMLCSFSPEIEAESQESPETALPCGIEAPLHFDPPVALSAIVAPLECEIQPSLNIAPVNMPEPAAPSRFEQIEQRREEATVEVPAPATLGGFLSGMAGTLRRFMGRGRSAEELAFQEQRDARQPKELTEEILQKCLDKMADLDGLPGVDLAMKRRALTTYRNEETIFLAVERTLYQASEKGFKGTASGFFLKMCELARENDLAPWAKPKPAPAPVAQAVVEPRRYTDSEKKREKFQTLANAVLSEITSLTPGEKALARMERGYIHADRDSVRLWIGGKEVEEVSYKTEIDDSVIERWLQTLAGTTPGVDPVKLLANWKGG